LINAAARPESSGHKALHFLTKAFHGSRGGQRFRPAHRFPYDGGAGQGRPDDTLRDQLSIAGFAIDTAEGKIVAKS
jgi:hypothetical protein